MRSIGTSHIPADLTAISLDQQAALLPVCPRCRRRGATVRVDGTAAPVCAACYIGHVPQPRPYGRRWVLLLLLAALIVALLAWGLAGGLLAVALPRPALTKCACGAIIWPGTKQCAACRNGG